MSEELVYAGYGRDLLAQYALGKFENMPSARVLALYDEEPCPHGSVMVISSYGTFPSRYGRIVKPIDEDRRQITSPPSAHYAKAVLALNRNAQELARQRPEHFLESLLNFHYVFLGQPRPCTTHKSTKRDWWLRHQNRAERHHDSL